MLKIFNSTALTQKQRFLNALLWGSLAGLVLTVLYVALYSFIHVEFSIVYLGLGFAIGWVIQETGHGVQIRFSILAAVICILVIFFGDLFSFFPAYYIFGGGFVECLRYLLAIYLSVDFSSVLSIIFRLGAIYLAFRYARVV